MSSLSEGSGTTNAGSVPAATPPEPTLASVLECMLTLQRQHNQLGEAVQRLAPPAQSALPADSQLQGSTSPAPGEQAGGSAGAGIGGSPASAPATSIGTLPSSEGGSASGESGARLHNTLYCSHNNYISLHGGHL